MVLEEEEGGGGQKSNIIPNMHRNAPIHRDIHTYIYTYTYMYICNAPKGRMQLAFVIIEQINIAKLPGR